MRLWGSRLRQSGGVLRKVLVAVGVEDRLGRVASCQALAVIMSISVILGATIASEVGSLVDNRPRLRIGPGDRGFPEGAAEAEGPELVGI